jgi:hypothetical protein
MDCSATRGGGADVLRRQVQERERSRRRRGRAPDAEQGAGVHRERVDQQGERLPDGEARPSIRDADSWLWETLMKKFTPAQLAALSSAYGTLNRVDPSQPTYRALTALLDKLPCSNLKQLVQADIKFVSGLARNRVARKNCKVG